MEVILKSQKIFDFFLDFRFLIEMSMDMKQEEPSSTWVKVWQNAASIRTPRHHTTATAPPHRHPVYKFPLISATSALR